MRDTAFAVDNDLDSNGRFKNPYAARKKLQEKLNSLRGIPITNRATGIVAQFGKEGIGKLVSDKAVKKTLSNGYTEKQHYAAAMNIKQLYEDATLSLQRPDRDNDPNIKDVKYFSCPTNVLGDDAMANIMVKNTVQHGHHIYTIELQELNKPAELKNQAVNDSSAGSKGSTHITRQDSTTVAEEPSIENITQTEDSGNIKYSARNLTINDTLSKDAEYLQAVKEFQTAKTDSERRTSYKKLKEMVENAAIKAGFENAVPEQTLAYKVRTTSAPKKTIKVYKVFTLADDGSPTALFISGKEKLPQGVWLDAQAAYHFTAKNGLEYVPSTQNPYTKGGKTGASVEIPNEKVRKELIERGFLPKGSTATKVTALAYRPGWHAGTLPFFPQGGMKPPKGMQTAYDNIHRFNQVVFECELSADKNYTAEAELQPKARNKDGSLNTRKADLQYMPENGFYYYATNPMTHGHPELGMWCISGSLKINRALTQEECDEILKANGKAPQEWEQGKLNLADLGYTGEQNDAARKTLAPITYDDAGNIIPLSQRFNAEKNDIRYSINASDNSFAAFAKKLENKFFGERHERYRKQMKESLENITGYKISTGHLASDDIAVKPNAKVIRTKSAYDWENILPAVGKVVAEKLNLPATDEMQNYIASWILDGTPNNTSAEAKEFQRAMQNTDDDYREKLLEAQNKFIAWDNKSAMEKAQAIISRQRDEKSLGEKFQEARAKGYDQFFEDIAPIKRLVDEIEKETGEKIPNSLNPYIALRNYKGMAGRARMMLEGNSDTAEILQAAYPNINFGGFKTLKTILDEVGASKDDDIYNEFTAYVTACHIKELHEENKKINKSISERQEKLEKAQEDLKNAKTKKGTAELEKRVLFHKNKIAESQNSKYVTSLTEKECDEIISQGKNRYGNSQRDLVRFSNTLLAIIQDSGLRNKFVCEKLMEKWKNYVPLHRLFDENENLEFGDSLKKIRLGKIEKRDAPLRSKVSIFRATGVWGASSPSAAKLTCCKRQDVAQLSQFRVFNKLKNR